MNYFPSRCWINLVDNLLEDLQRKELLIEQLQVENRLFLKSLFHADFTTDHPDVFYAVDLWRCR